MKRYWNEYQKEIADDHFFYERSCIRQTFFVGSETTFLRVLRKELGRHHRENPRQRNYHGTGDDAEGDPIERTMTAETSI